MKSNSNERPDIIERVAPNRYRFNYNIREVEREEPSQGDDETEATTRIVYEYDFVEFTGRPDRKNIVRLIIREEKNESEEFELINRYNAAKLKMENYNDAEEEYKAWLQRVEEIKAMVGKQFSD